MVESVKDEERIGRRSELTRRLQPSSVCEDEQTLLNKNRQMDGKEGQDRYGEKIMGRD
jgi:hypothetical protein